MVVLIFYVVLLAVVGKVEVVGLRGILGGEGVYLLHHGDDAEFLAGGAHEVAELLALLLHAVAVEGASHLEVAESLLFGQPQKVFGKFLYAIVFVQLARGEHYIVQFLEEP